MHHSKVVRCKRVAHRSSCFEVVIGFAERESILDSLIQVDGAEIKRRLHVIFVSSPLQKRLSFLSIASDGLEAGESLRIGFKRVRSNVVDHTKSIHRPRVITRSLVMLDSDVNVGFLFKTRHQPKHIHQTQAIVRSLVFFVYLESFLEKFIGSGEVSFKFAFANKIRIGQEVKTVRVSVLALLIQQVDYVIGRVQMVYRYNTAEAGDFIDCLRPHQAQLQLRRPDQTVGVLNEINCSPGSRFIIVSACVTIFIDAYTVLETGA